MTSVASKVGDVPTLEEQPLRIDTHTHILPKNWPDFKQKFGYGGFIQLDHHVEGWARMMKDDGTFFREVEEDLWDMDARLQYMDAMGIDVQVCCTVPVMFSYWAKPEDTVQVCHFLNDDLAEKCKQHPRRMVGLGTLPMQAPELAVAEVRRAMATGLAGFQIGSHVEDMTLDDPRLFPVFQEMEKCGACLMIHPWDMMGKGLMKKYWLPWLVSMPAETSLAVCSLIFGGIFERLPKLRVLFAHAGGSFPATVGRVKHGFDCRPDLCAVDNPNCPTGYMGNFWVDHLTHSSKQLKYVIELLGENRVCFGTDYPFPLGECYPLKKPGELVDALSLPEASDESRIKRQLLGLNAIEWLVGASELGERTQYFLQSPHRSSKLPWSAIVSLTDASFVGTYGCEGGGSLILQADGAFRLEGNAETTDCAGRWRVATYSRTGAPNSDILLEASPASSADSDTSRDGPEAGPPALLRQRSEWELFTRRKIVLSDPDADGARTARFVDAFDFGNLKRSSGHNDLLEGQKAPTQ